MGHNSKCFVPFCKTGYNSCKKKYSLFSAPKDAKLRKLWEKAICREDKKLSDKDVVCAMHFVETDIIKEWVSGHIIIPYKKPRLIPLAIPSVFSYKPPSNIDKPKKKIRIRNIHDKSSKSIPSILAGTSTHVTELNATDFTNNVFNELWLKRDVLKMPNAEWALHYIDKNEKKTILISECSVTSDGVPSFLRNIILDHNAQVKSFLSSMEISEESLSNLSLQLSQFTNTSDIQNYIDKFGRANICAGGPSTKVYSLNNVAIKTAKVDVNGLWRHISCPLIFNDSDQRCFWCKRVYDYFINHLLFSKSSHI